MEASLKIVISSLGRNDNFLLLMIKILTLFEMTANFLKNAQKKGETVDPAGGGTGRPRCLAEVHELHKTQFISKKLDKK